MDSHATRQMRYRGTDNDDARWLGASGRYIDLDETGDDFFRPTELNDLEGMAGEKEKDDEVVAPKTFAEELQELNQEVAAQQPKDCELELAKMAQARAQGHHKSQSTQEPPSMEPSWRPWWLRPAVLAVFFLIFLIPAAGVPGLYVYSRINDGLVSTSRNFSNLEYLWRFGPTAAFTVLAATWSRVEIQAMRYMPWFVLAQRARGEEGNEIFLDYTDMMLPIALVQSARNRHWMVFLAMVTSLFIRVQIVLGPGLFHLTTVQRPVQVPVQVTDRFADLVGEQTTLSPAGYDLLQGMNLFEAAPPFGASNAGAYQLFQAVGDGEENSPLEVVVDGFFADAECISVDTCTTTFARESRDAQRLRSELYNITISFPACQGDGTFTFDEARFMHPLDPDSFAMVEAANTNLTTPRPCRGLGIDQPQFVVFFARYRDFSANQTFQPDTCAAAICSPTIWTSKVRVTDYGTRQTVENLGGERVTIPRAGPGFEHALSVSLPSTISPPGTPRTFADEGAGSLDDIDRLVGAAASVDDYNGEYLAELMREWFQNAGPLVAHYHMREASSSQVVGSRLVPVDRLVVDSRIAIAMTALSACAATVCLWMLFAFLPKTAFFLRDPATLLGAILVLKDRLQHLRSQHANQSQVSEDARRKLGSSGGNSGKTIEEVEIRLTDTADSRRSMAPARGTRASYIQVLSSPSSPFSRGASTEAMRETKTSRGATAVNELAATSRVPARDGRIQQRYDWSRCSHSPMALRLWMRLPVTIGLLLVVAGLSTSLYLSETREGLATIMDDQYIHLAWTILPAFVVFCAMLYAIACNTAVRNLTIFSSLAINPTDSRQLDMSFHDMFGPVLLWHSVRLRFWTVTLTETLALLASLLSVFASTLFTLQVRPGESSVVLQQTGWFGAQTGYQDNVFNMLRDVDSAVEGRRDVGRNAIGALVAGQDGTISFPRNTYGDLVFPTVQLAPSASQPTNSSITARLPALRLQHSCAKLDESRQALRFEGSEIVGDADSTSLDFSISGPMVVANGSEIDVAEWARFGVGPLASLGLQNVSLFAQAVRTPLPFIPDEFVFPEEMDPTMPAEPRIDQTWREFTFVWGVANATALEARLVGMYACNYTWAELDVDVTFSGNDLSIQAENPPVPDMSSLRQPTGLVAVPLFNPVYMFSYALEFQERMDTYFAPMAGVGELEEPSNLGAPFFSLTPPYGSLDLTWLRDPQASELVLNEIHAGYGFTVAQLLNLEARTNLTAPVAPLMGLATDSSRLRLIQRPEPTYVIVAIIGLIALAGVYALLSRMLRQAVRRRRRSLQYLVDMDLQGVAPLRAWSIASMARLLGESNVFEWLPKGAAMLSPDELHRLLEGKRFRLGWFRRQCDQRVVFTMALMDGDMTFVGAKRDIGVLDG